METVASYSTAVEVEISLTDWIEQFKLYAIRYLIIHGVNPFV